MIVTDKKYYLPQYLVENLMRIPVHLADAWDCVYIVSGHGKVRIGKCLHSSVVIKVNSEGNILNKSVGELNDGERINVVSYDFKKEKRIDSTQAEVMKTPLKDFYEIKTDKGYKTICSMDHRLFFKRGEEIIELPLSEYQEGDELVYHIFNPKFFYLKGAFDGDGHYSKKRKIIQIGVVDFDFLEEIKKKIKEVFNKDVKISNHTAAHDNCKEQRRINFCSAEHFDKFKDEPISIQEKIEYLKGLWDAEGSVGMCKKKVRKSNGKVYEGNDKWLTLAQNDKCKLDYWHNLMLGLGISSMKTYRNDTRSFLSIRDNLSIKKFAELIGFRIKRKQNILNKLISYLGQSKLSSIDKAKIIRIYNETNFGSEYIAKMFGRSKPAILSILRNRKINTSKYRQRIITNQDIEKAEDILGFNIPFVICPSKFKQENQEHKRFKEEEIEESEEKIILRSSRIKSILFHSKEVGVDLYVPEFGNFFLSNGILSHNSTLAANTGYFIAWLLAGGELEEYTEAGKNDKVLKKFRIKKEPNEPPRFSIENIVFTPKELIEAAAKLPKHSVIIYDEGRAGLESKRAMANVNKAMEDFFQECGQYGHVLIIVLPNFFKLAEDYAVDRSLFLLDVFAVPKGARYERGYFRFYNEAKKEMLYHFGKRRYTIESKYSSVRPNFWGKFTNFFPLDRKEYDKKKKLAIEEKGIKKPDGGDEERKLTYEEQAKQDAKFKSARLNRILWQRNVAIAILNQEQGIPNKRIAEIFNRVCDKDEKISPDIVEKWFRDFKLEKARRLQMKEELVGIKNEES